MAGGMLVSLGSSVPVAGTRAVRLGLQRASASGVGCGRDDREGFGWDGVGAPTGTVGRGSGTRGGVLGVWCLPVVRRKGTWGFEDCGQRWLGCWPC